MIIKKQKKNYKAIFYSNNFIVGLKVSSYIISQKNYMNLSFT